MVAARARCEVNENAPDDARTRARLLHHGELHSVLMNAFDLWRARDVRNVTISIGDHVHLNSDHVEAIFAAMNETRAERA